MDVRVPIQNVFCPTGVGGGVDATCSPSGRSKVPKDIKGSGTSEDPYRCGSDIRLAAHLLADGHHIRLKQPDQVATLLDKMQDMVKEAEKLGAGAPSFDLCHVTVKNTNLFCQESLGVPRVKMPQLKGTPTEGSEASKLPKDEKGQVDLSKSFIDYLKGRGISTKETEVPASHLRASQNEIVGARVAKLVAKARDGKKDLMEKPIFVTRDNYVVDGHHHWAAIVGLGYSQGKDLKIPVHKLDMDIGQALDMANDYTKRVGIAPKSTVANLRSFVANLFRDLFSDGGHYPIQNASTRLRPRSQSARDHWHEPTRP